MPRRTKVQLIAQSFPWWEDLARMLTVLRINGRRGGKRKAFGVRVLESLGFQPSQAPDIQRLLAAAEEAGHIHGLNGSQPPDGDRLFISRLLQNRGNRGYVPLVTVDESEGLKAVDELRYPDCLVALEWLEKQPYVVLAGDLGTVVEPLDFPVPDSLTSDDFMDRIVNLGCVSPASKDESLDLVCEVLDGRCREILAAITDPCYLPRGRGLEDTILADVCFQAQEGATYFCFLPSERAWGTVVCTAEEYRCAMDWLVDRLVASRNLSVKKPAVTDSRFWPYFFADMRDVGVLRSIDETDYAVDQSRLREIREAIARPRLIPRLLTDARARRDQKQGRRRKPSSAIPVDQLWPIRKESEMSETVPKRVLDIVSAVYSVGDPEHNDRALEERAIAAIKVAVPALARTDDEHVRRQLRTLSDDEGWLSFHTADGVTRWGVSLKAVGKIGLLALKKVRAQPSGQSVPASPPNEEHDEPATPQPTPASELPPSSPDQPEAGEADGNGDKGNGMGERQQQVLSAVSESAGTGGWAEDSVIFAALTRQPQWFGAPWYKFTAELRKLVSGGHLQRGEGKRKGHYRLVSDGGGGSEVAEPVGTRDEGEDEDKEEREDEKKGGSEMPGSNDGGQKSGGGRMTYDERRRFGWDNTPGDTPEEKMAHGIHTADMQRIFGLGTPGSAAMHAKQMVKEGDLRRIARGVYKWAVFVDAFDADTSHVDGEDKPKKTRKPVPKKGGGKKPKAGKKGQSEEPQAASPPVKVVGADTSLRDTVAAVAEMSPWFPEAMKAAQCLSTLSVAYRWAALKAAEAITKLPVEQQKRAYQLVVALCGLEGSGGGFADDGGD